VVAGVTSVYRWQGEVRRDAEALIILKTIDVRSGELTRRIAELHPYDVPEVLVVEAVGGFAPYLEWVRDETTSGSEGRT
jgi:periplasmic divalent cation tolerance protein